MGDILEQRVKNVQCLDNRREKLVEGHGAEVKVLHYNEKPDLGVSHCAQESLERRVFLCLSDIVSSGA